MDDEVSDAIYELARAGIANGKGGGEFGVNDTFLRCEVATIVARMVKLIEPVRLEGIYQKSERKLNNEETNFDSGACADDVRVAAAGDGVGDGGRGVGDERRSRSGVDMVI